MDPSHSIKAVVSVSGRDQKGVVARFATYLAQRGVNIEDIEQQVVHGTFIMDMLVELAEMTLSLDELITGLLELGKEVEMQVRVVLHGRPRPKRLAVLVSKEGHCLERLIKDAQSDAFGGRGEIQCVLSNHPDLGPVAENAGLDYEWRSTKEADGGKPAHMDWLLQRLRAWEVDLVVLGRYMQVAPPEIVQAYPNQIINIHPSLLPYFPGPAPYRQAWDSGVRVTGCTAHFVTEALDAGPIILQNVFHIDVGHDTAEEVKHKGQALEADVLSQATRMALDEKLLVVEDKVVFRPGLSSLFDHGSP